MIINNQIVLVGLALLSTASASEVLKQRLIISDVQNNTIKVLSASNFSALAQFDTVGKASNVYAASGGEHVFAIHRTENRVTVIHSGLSAVSHGDHHDLKESSPYILHTLNVGRQPTHFYSADGEVFIFNDQDGTIAVLEEEKLGLSLDYEQVTAEKPDHGALGVLDNTILVGYLNLNKVDIFDLSGKKLSTIEGCPSLHGSAKYNNTVVFGCTDGVIGIQKTASGYRNFKIPNPANTPENVRVGTVIAHPKSKVMYGNFGKGLVQFSPQEQGVLKVMALPEAPVKFLFDASGEHVVVLTASGELLKLNINGEIVGRVQASQDATKLDKTATRATFALIENEAIVTHPALGQLSRVNLSDFSIQTVSIGGQPASLAVAGISGTMDH